MELLDLINKALEEITQLKNEVLEIKTAIKSLEKDVTQIHSKNEEIEKLRDEVMALKSQLLPSPDVSSVDSVKVCNHTEKSAESMGEYNRFPKHADNR